MMIAINDACAKACHCDHLQAVAIWFLLVCPSLFGTYLCM